MVVRAREQELAKGGRRAYIVIGGGPKLRKLPPYGNQGELVPLGAMIVMTAWAAAVEQGCP